MTGILGLNNKNEYVLYNDGFYNGERIINCNLSQLFNKYKNNKISLVLNNIYKFIGQITSSMLFIGIRTDLNIIDRLDLDIFLSEHQGQELDININLNI